MLGLYGNMLTADHMYSRHRWEKLWEKVKRLSSQKRGIFSAIFIAFFESTQDFAHFQKNNQLHSLNISEGIDPDKCGYFNLPKLLF